MARPCAKRERHRIPRHCPSPKRSYPARSRPVPKDCRSLDQDCRRLPEPNLPLSNRQPPRAFLYRWSRIRIPTALHEQWLHISAEPLPAPVVSPYQPPASDIRLGEYDEVTLRKSHLSRRMCSVSIQDMKA